MKRDTYTVSRNRLVGGWDVVNRSGYTVDRHTSWWKAQRAAARARRLAR